MLSEDERRAIEAEVATSHDRRAACVEALRTVQRIRGYVSDETLRDVAGLLEMTADELDGVATFFSLIFRKPVGRHVLKVCDSVVCWVMGGESLMSYLERKLGLEQGGTTADGRYTLLPICCLGDCSNAPAMMIDDTLVRRLTPELIDKLVPTDVPVRG